MTNHYKNFTKDERGASSVLVIFMMLVLVTLGAFAITSANANYKFSQRGVEWNKMYYGLDSKGEEFLAMLDSKLAMAESDMLNYVNHKSYEAPSLTEIPQELQTQIYNEYRSTGINNDYITWLVNKLYFHYCYQYLTELSLTYPDTQVYTIEEGNMVGSVLAEIKLEEGSPSTEIFGLSISIRIPPVTYIPAGTNTSITLVRGNDDLRYVIEDWHEYQNPVIEESGEELWDGSFE